MIRGTTPTLTLKIPGRDLSDAEIIATIKNTGRTLNKGNSEMDVRYSEGATFLDIPFSQQETLEFATGRSLIQVNWLYQNGVREATEMASIYIGANLYDKVMDDE